MWPVAFRCAIAWLCRRCVVWLLTKMATNAYGLHLLLPYSTQRKSRKLRSNFPISLVGQAMTRKYLTVFALLLSIPTVGQSTTVDYCSYGNHASLILVDRTTSYDDLDKNVFAAGLRIVDGLGTGDRVIIHAIKADFVRGERAFDHCMPGCPKKGLRLALQCPSRADRTTFVRDLAITARHLLDNPLEFPRSDIARSIARVTSSIRSPVDSASPNLVEVYLFSDLIENSTELPWPAIVNSPPRIG